MIGTMKKSQVRAFMHEARKNVDKHPIWEHPKRPKFFHFTYLMQHGNLLAVGMNRMGQAPSWYPEHALIHSEVDAWRRCKNQLDLNSKFEILNLRFNRFGDVRMSKPCNSCHRLLYELGCGRVYFTTDLGLAKMDI